MPNHNVDCTVEEVQSSMHSSLINKNSVQRVDPYSQPPPINSLPKELRVPYDMIVNKPFYLKTFQWANTAAAGDEIHRLYLPSELFINQPIAAPFNFAAKYRLKVKLDLQVMGTPQHSGALLVASIPSGSSTFSHKTINNMMCSPHVILSANESTPASLVVPFYSPTRLRNTSPFYESVVYDEYYDYADVSFGVLAPLSPSATSSSTVSVSIYVTLLEAEFYIPANQQAAFHPQSLAKECCTSCLARCAGSLCAMCLCSVFTPEAAIVTKALDGIASGIKQVTGDLVDAGRQSLRSYIGLHNPNKTSIEDRMIVGKRNFANVVDVPTFVEKLDPYSMFDRVVQEPIFHTTIDEMDIGHIISKPQFLGTMNITTETSEGTVLWSRPITPLQDRWDIVDHPVTTIQGLMSLMTRAWRGKMYVHFFSVMNNFQTVKIMVSKDYTCRAGSVSGTNNLDDVNILMTDTIEFSGGGQTQTVELPYCSELSQIQNAIDTVTNVLSHGVYSVRLVQPLIVGSGSPTTAKILVFISCDPEFSFYGYSVTRFKISDTGEGSARASRPQRNPVQPNVVEEIGTEVVMDFATMQPENPAFISTAGTKKKTQSLPKERKISPISVPNSSTTKKEPVSSTHKKTTQFMPESACTILPASDPSRLLLPGEISNSFDAHNMRPVKHVRDMLRRYLPVGQAVPPLADQAFGTVRVNIADLLKLNSTDVTHYGRLVRRMFLGHSGGFKFKVIGSGCRDFKVSYLPPSMYVEPAQYDGPTARGHILNCSSSSLRAAVYNPQRFPDDVAIGSIASDDYIALPFIEGAEPTAQPMTVSTPSTIEGATATVPLSTSMVEIMVPYMNVLDFIGKRGVNDANYTSYSADYGSLLISYTKTDGTGTAQLAQSYMTYFTFYMAYADESRLGFQVYSPAAIPEVADASSEHFLTNPYLKVDGTAHHPGTFAYAPGAYIGNFF